MVGLTVYRELLRATRAAFRHDMKMLTASRAEIRSKFEDSRMETDPKVVQELLGNGREASDFIRTHVVQGVMNDGGNFEVKLEEHHGDKIMSQEFEGECSSNKK
eukprot:CAMPEP_0114298380 /NCGR_PEP_ID=MMETSP0059-20121206/12387_1 /TAXON_ID=36894 /ORGANISM="Pyramimonas parkeae, Strain CCMP726" /LENGTH=103 /DNA_ID=CAMNT_0001420737 /DNA_START=63 /DNA_END=374 /DNA_ORIENTATION=+